MDSATPVVTRSASGHVDTSRAQWWLATVARSLEDVLPVSEPRREKLREKQTVLKVLSNIVVLFFVIWGIIGLVCLLRITSKAVGFEDATADGVGGLTLRRANSVRAVGGVNRSWKPANASYDFLHGPLGRPIDGRPHEFESSLRFSLDREVSDHRSQECRTKSFGTRYPSTSVIIIFCNEPFETLMRSVHSVFNRSPVEILHEIILVDDGSDADHIKSVDQGGNGLLEEYMKLLPPKIRLLRTGRRAGIVQARLTGIRAAEGEAFVILDSHIECQPGWLEPLVSPIAEDKATVVMPHIDGIDKRTFEPKKGGVGCTLGIIWKVMEHAFHADQYSPSERRNAKESDYVTSPTMAGGLFAAHRDWFLSIGGYDEAMSGWGAENVEFSFRLWQCGGRLLCTECSRVYHMFGGGKHYKTGGSSTTSNRMRTVASWADEYADLAWHILGKPPLSEIGDISEILKIRRQKKCKDFKWYLNNVWPESEVINIPDDVPYMGSIRSVIDGDFCFPRTYRGERKMTLDNCDPNNPVGFIYWKREGRITPETNDEQCFLTNNKWDWCYYDDLRRWQLEDLTDDKFEIYQESLNKAISGLWETQGDIRLVRLKDDQSEKCITAVPLESGGYGVDILACNDRETHDQLWLWSKYKVNPYWKSLHDN